MRLLEIVTETTGRIAGSSSPGIVERKKWFCGGSGAGQMVSNQRVISLNYQVFTVTYVLYLELLLPKCYSYYRIDVFWHSEPRKQNVSRE